MSQTENLLCDKMIELDVKKLTSCNSDWEMNQYTLLRIVKEWESNFRKNKLYPHLNESIELQRKLQDILQENLESKYWLEREIRPRKVNNEYVTYEKAHIIGLGYYRIYGSPCFRSIWRRHKGRRNL